MRLRKVYIKNFRSCKNIEIDLLQLTTLVGANNAGKSTILKALDFLFNPSVSKITEETYWAMDTDLEIRIEGIFDQLTSIEKENFSPYLKPDLTLQIARTAKYAKSTPEENKNLETEEGKIKISQQYSKLIPKYEWLQVFKISGMKIEEWWRNQSSLIANNHSFVNFVGSTKPNVTNWKEQAEKFALQFLKPDDYMDEWIENPQGYAGVLKGYLPHFILIPAVRDLRDESKATKSNPLGSLLYAILSSFPIEQTKVLEKSMQEMQKLLNKTGGSDRISQISEIEDRLNTFVKEYMPSCNLEIEFQPPSLEMLLTSPRIFADDGFRNSVENKGHGLQRAVIFSILRCYSELITGKGKEKKKTMILGIEEPEIYMHPQAQRTIRNVFKKITENEDQIIFSTHSSLLLDVAYFDEIVRMETKEVTHKGNKTLESKVYQLPLYSIITDFQKRHPSKEVSDYSIRELYANAYHPTRAEGFFAKRLILVEGATEQYAFPIYAKALNILLDSENIGIVDCGGKGPMDRLYRIFNELGIPSYLVFDYDNGSTDKEIIGKAKELLKLMNYPTDPPAEILITSKFSCFPNCWEDDLQKEIPAYGIYKSEAKKELGLKDESGKPLIARYIANKLTKQATPFVPESLSRILNMAITVEWEKSCLS